MSDTYCIKRVYFRKHGRKHTLARGLSRAEAAEWIRDPETSSKTCRSPYKVRLTRLHGAWFDAMFKE